MELALDKSKSLKTNLDDIGFILTVLRDNTTDDYVHLVLDNLIKNNA